MAGETAVRPVRAGDREAWEPLWQGYLTFYEASLVSDVTDATWRRFFDPLEPLGAFVAERGGRLIGFAHYLLHRSTWARTHYLYLEDLYVADGARGKGVGRALIEHVTDIARHNDCARVYWVTQDANEVARIVYDKLADAPGLMTYFGRM